MPIKPKFVGPFDFEDESCYLIPLSKGQWTLVNEASLTVVVGYKWFVSWNKCTKSFYAVRKGRSAEGKRLTIRMSREVLGLPVGREKVGDHRNHDTLDNRLSNLRACTQAQNCWNRAKHSNNSSGFKGVSLHTKSGKWQAQICVNGVCKHLGFYETPQAAYDAYCKAAADNFGEFARTA